jgi:hypothetical protein
MGIIKNLTQPIAFAAIKLSYPTINPDDMGPSVEELEQQVADEQAEKDMVEKKYTDLKEKQKQFEDELTLNGNTDKAKSLAPTENELEFIANYDLERALELQEIPDLPKASSGDVTIDIANDFSKKFAELYEVAIKNFLSICGSTPIGGPKSITIMGKSNLQDDLQTCGEEAFKQTYPDPSQDKDKHAEKFGKKFAEIATEPHEQEIMKWQAIPASPPLIPTTPGGPVIAIPSVSLITVILDAAKSALIETFDGNPDKKDIATKFATILSPIGILMGVYALTCNVPLGGGMLIVS